VTGHTDIRVRPYKPIVTSEVPNLRGRCCSALYRYWLEKRRDAALPDWAAFAFMDLYRIAPFMFVLDVTDPDDAGRLYYRFMGTQLVAYRRLRRFPDLTGKYFSECDRAYDPAAMAAAYMDCARSGRPVLMTGEYRTENSFGLHERLLLPWTIGGKVLRLTGALDRFPGEE